MADVVVTKGRLYRITNQAFSSWDGTVILVTDANVRPAYFSARVVTSRLYEPMTLLEIGYDSAVHGWMTEL